MELRWPRGTVIRNQVSWRLPFPVPGSDPFPSYRGCQRPEGPTPGFWEVAPRKAKNVSAKVSNKILTTRVHHRDPHLLPWIPLRAKQILPELPSPPALSPSPPLISSWVSCKSQTPPGSRGAGRRSGWLPLPYRFPRQPRAAFQEVPGPHPQPNFTHRQDWNREEKWLSRSKAATKRHPFIPHFLKFMFNWRIIALQYCVGFRHTTTCIRPMYTYVPSLSNLPPTHCSFFWSP